MKLTKLLKLIENSGNQMFPMFFQEDTLSIRYRAKDSNTPYFINPDYFSSKNFFDESSYEIPEFPLLAASADMITNRDFPRWDNTFLAMRQHILEGTYKLIKAQQRIGTPKENISIIGKYNTTNSLIYESIAGLNINLLPDVFPEYYGQNIQAGLASINVLLNDIKNSIANKNLIAVEDGGMMRQKLPQFLNSLPTKQQPKSVITIEQTRGGLYQQYNGVKVSSNLHPVIAVGVSAAKQFIEGYMIASAVLRKCAEIIEAPYLDGENRIAVIGAEGFIGKALAEKLQSSGHEVITYDIKTPSSHKVKSIPEAISEADTVFSCTGQDITKYFNPSEIKIKNNAVRLCGLNSGEFNSFLSEYKIPKKDHGKNAEINNDVATNALYFQRPDDKFIIVENGGTGINFDRRPYNVPADEIELTMCLMFWAIQQAHLTAHQDSQKPKGLIKLDPSIQQYIVLSWWNNLVFQRKIPSFVRDFFGNDMELTYSKLIKQFKEDVDWISQNSGGQHLPVGFQNVLNNT